ncbi:MAG: AraC family transcriptional regulator N-terminal domain-containing protein [Acidobacteriaceae bacterium]|nr:AraC family transcriptional regulator N-terminal domain-containing protein [Acidobacteriaceae bacterium]MBV8571587.1 AraC family transcriptional regulator N-terminal domain-containing protein [Acidobacteriaceae bacterium]
MSTAETSVELLGAFDRLLDLLNAPQDIPFISSLVQREITCRIVTSDAGERLRAIVTAGDQSYRTAKVIAWIRANYTETLRGANPRSLRRSSVRRNCSTLQMPSMH